VSLRIVTTNLALAVRLKPLPTSVRTPILLLTTV